MSPSSTRHATWAVAAAIAVVVGILLWTAGLGILWELLWHAIPHRHPDRELVQALIQAAAFVIKRHTQTERAATALLGRSLARLHALRAAQGPIHMGVHLLGLTIILRDFEAGGPWPRVPMAR